MNAAQDEVPQIRYSFASILSQLATKSRLCGVEKKGVDDGMVLWYIKFVVFCFFFCISRQCLEEYNAATLPSI